MRISGLCQGVLTRETQEGARVGQRCTPEPKPAMTHPSIRSLSHAAGVPQERGSKFATRAAAGHAFTNGPDMPRGIELHGVSRPLGALGIAAGATRGGTAECPGAPGADLAEGRPRLIGP